MISRGAVGAEASELWAEPGSTAEAVAPTAITRTNSRRVGILWGLRILSLRSGDDAVGVVSEFGGDRQRGSTAVRNQCGAPTHRVEPRLFPKHDRTSHRISPAPSQRELAKAVAPFGLRLDQARGTCLTPSSLELIAGRLMLRRIAPMWRSPPEVRIYSPEIRRRTVRG